MRINYLPCEIYRPSFGDCSNYGISHHFDRVALVLPDGNCSFDPALETPPNLCLLRADVIFGSDKILRVFPAMVNEAGEVVKRPGWWMNGGCFVSGDSRFSEACERLLGSRFCGAVMLMDRRED